jgi:fatty acid desaturase
VISADLKESRMSSVAKAATCTPSGRWALERVLFALAGTLTLTSAAMAVAVSPWFLLLAAFVAVNQLLFASVGACPASLVLSRLFGLQSAAARGASR